MLRLQQGTPGEAEAFQCRKAGEALSQGPVSLLGDWVAVRQQCVLEDIWGKRLYMKGKRESIT